MIIPALSYKNARSFRPTSSTVQTVAAPPRRATNSLVSLPPKCGITPNLTSNSGYQNRKVRAAKWGAMVKLVL